MTQEEVIKELKKELAKYSSQTKLAEEIGVYPSFLNAVLWGRRSPGIRIMNYLGIEEVRAYRKKKPDSQ